MLGRIFNLADSERQSLATWAMLGGAVAMTATTAVLVWIIRYSWSSKLLNKLAPDIVDKLAWIAFGSLALVAIMTVTMASIANGGRIKGKLGPAEFESETEAATANAKVTTVTELSTPLTTVSQPEMI